MRTKQSQLDIGTPRPWMSGLSTTVPGLDYDGYGWSDAYAINRFGAYSLPVNGRSGSDYKFARLRALGHTGAINDMTLSWLQDNGATSNCLPDAWAEMLAAAGFSIRVYGTRTDAWFALLGSLGYSGAINDRERNFWRDQYGGNEWIMAGGYWDDAGIWDDENVWID